jgi:ClpP class serine protease
MDAMSGLVSYSMIEQQLALALRAPEVKGILFDIDSEGGEVKGMVDAADLIFQSRGQKPIWAIADDWAFSAAYGLASAA